MAKKARYLTDEDVETLIRDHRILHGVPNQADFSRTEHPSQSPEVYIAKVPTGGILARSGTAPGNATCEIFKIKPDDGTLEIVEDLEKEVFNLTTEDISDGGASGKYIVVQRDKFGKWVYTESGGGLGGTTFVYFSAAVDRDRGSATFSAHYMSHFPSTNTAPQRDAQGNFEAWDGTFFYTLIRQGCQGIAVYNNFSLQWEVIQCQQQSILGIATIRVESGSQTGMCDQDEALIEDFQGISPAPFDFQPNPLPDAAKNPYWHKGKKDDQVLLQWDESLVDWVVIDVVKKETKLVVLQDDGVTLKEIKAAVEYCKDPQATSVSFMLRGKASGGMPKGQSSPVGRYNPGTTNPSGITDSVFNELATIGPNHIVYYAKNGSVFYVFATECPLE